MFFLQTYPGQFPPFFSVDYWQNVLQNAIGCSIGSFIAIGISLWIYYRSNRTNEREKRQEIIKEQNDTLVYFTELIKNIIASSKQQAGGIQDFINVIEHNKIAIPLLTFVGIYDFKRVSESNSLEKVLIAYINKYPGNAGAIKEFREIVSTVDYLLGEFELLPAQLEKAQKYDYERKQKIEALFADSYKVLGNFMLGQDQDRPNEQVKQIQLLMNVFQDKFTGNADIKYYYDSFFVPFNDLMVEFLSHGLHSPFFVNLAQLTRDGKQIFNLIQKQNAELADDLHSINIKVKKTIPELEVYSSRLLIN